MNLIKAQTRVALRILRYNQLLIRINYFIPIKYKQVLVLFDGKHTFFVSKGISTTESFYNVISTASTTRKTIT